MAGHLRRPRHQPPLHPTLATPDERESIECFHRTLVDEWTYHQPYTSETQRQNAFPDWLDWYNYHRPHTGTNGNTPASRGTNLTE